MTNVMTGGAGHPARAGAGITAGGTWAYFTNEWYAWRKD